MCGISGFIERKSSSSHEQLTHLAAKMASSLQHRGPDDSGTWVDVEHGVALGHTRLSILDLSPTGRQPMRSSTGQFTLVYNGEIYNHKELRKQLIKQGSAFRGHSDTEVLLAAIEQWGIEAAIKRCNGMFAAAIWNRDQQQLSLVRDRVGIKPLYYGWQGDTFMFGSELKALKSHPEFRGEIDRDVLSLFFRHNYIPGKYSIYQGISKLRPGTILQISTDNHCGTEQTTNYWSASDVVSAGQDNAFRGTDEEAVEALDELLKDAIQRRTQSDVPLGAFLSGGIDSSTIVALMQAQRTQSVDTFSIGFSEASYNEAEYARGVAKHLGTNHHEWYVSPEDAREVIPSLPDMFDEPFADSSQIPTFLVSKLARQSATVCLSGDGGDELFGGYARYLEVPRQWGKLSRIPRPIRTALAPIAAFAGKMSPIRSLSRKGRNLGDHWRVPHAQAMYVRLVSLWKPSDAVVLDSRSPVSNLQDFEQWSIRNGFLEQMMHVDLVTYLPDDILVKVDRTSMAVGLEARVPLLDHRVVEFAWTLPSNMRIRNGDSKWLLRQVLDRYVPRSLVNRPKAGFAVPIDAWLRGPLRDWAEALLDPQRLADEGLLNVTPIREKWEAHLAGKCNWHFHLWGVLMFQAWLERNS